MLITPLLGLKGLIPSNEGLHIQKYVVVKFLGVNDNVLSLP